METDVGVRCNVKDNMFKIDLIVWKHNYKLRLDIF